MSLNICKDINIPKEKWIDSHCHYECSKFKKESEEIMDFIKNYCKKVICVGTNTKENQGVINLSNKYDFVYNMVGYFPTSVDSLDINLNSEAQKNIDKLIYQLKHKKNVGLGEIGLDYNWDKVGTVEGEKAREIQKKWFIEQINIAREMNKPISIHSRDAELDTVNILKMFDNLTGVVHCFSYSSETAAFCIEKGLYLGIGGTSTYRNNEELRKAIKETPIERILLETDAPYLTPEPIRRTVNTSANIYYVIQLIAKLKGISEEEVIIQTNKNCDILYNFK